ncbi:MAG: winged helix-turn-helix domain-containing protein [Hyphomonadaceae bacterium]|nr:winged helix-turn-helix domain-containing protein [Hyphomonadaceae bacterium]
MSASPAGQPPEMAPVELSREPDFTIGSLSIRPSSCDVAVGGESKHIEPRIMQVLVALWRQRGRIVSRDDLTASCWAGVVVSDSAIHRAVAQVRKIASLSEPRAFEVETVPKLGYRLLAPEVAGEASGAGGRPIWRQRSFAVLAAALALILAGAAGLALLTPRNQSFLIAALPFDTAGDNSLSPFSATLADRVAGILGGQEMVALSPARAALYRGDHGEHRAAEDHVALIVDGLVQRQGDTTRISARIQHPQSGAVLWSLVFDRATPDETNLIDQTAARLADVLKCAAIGLRHDARSSAEALGAFLRACEAQRFNPGDWEPLRTLALRATELQPNFSQAWSLLALGNANQAFFAPSEQAPRLRAEAEQAARLALRLDRRNGQAYMALSLLEADWRAQKDLLDRAMALDPDNGDLHLALAYHMLAIGQTSEAARFARRSRWLDPLSRRFATHTIAILAAAGDKDEALALADESMRLWPDYQGGRLNYFYSAMFFGDAERRQRAFDFMLSNVAFPSAPESRDLWRHYMRARQGREPAALAVRAVIDAENQGIIPAQQSIVILSALGDVDRAFDRAFEYAGAHPGPFQEHFFLFLAPLEPMRRDPRFMMLASELGLLAFWRERGLWPDFCADPSWPYDCRAVAAQISAH